MLLASVDTQGKPNVMTIGWGAVGTIWGRPIFMILVRPSRYTFNLINATGEYTVNVPIPELGDAVSYFGSVSGRDQDKFKVKGLTATQGKKVGCS